MQYVRSTFGSVSKTWNSINPATLSGAIDVIVVEQQDGTLACSPFHVRFGKFSLLRPSEKKVEFYVNNVRQDYAMKLGEGGEAFFVFETSAAVPEALQTSPLVSPSTSPQTRPTTPGSDVSTATGIPPLDLASESPKSAYGGLSKARESLKPLPIISPEDRVQLGLNDGSHVDQPLSQSFPTSSNEGTILGPPIQLSRAPASEDVVLSKSRVADEELKPLQRTNSPPLLPKHEAVSRAMALSKRLLSSNIHATINDQGDLMLDMTGYKSSEEEVARAEIVARQILSEEIEGNYDIGSLIGADDKGNLWIYSSEEAKDAAARKAAAAYGSVARAAISSTDALSDPGYHSDDLQSAKSFDLEAAQDRESDSALGLSTPPDSPSRSATEPIRTDVSRNYAKTLRLTSDQLKALELKPGANPVSFTVNRATCQAYMYLWKHDVPIVVSDVDGTITKSDVLGHVMNTIGRDWTHLGVAKLYSDIVANGYNIFYLTSRSVGQADTTRAYLNGINQEGYRLPRGPVIMSPDRTIAALRREIYLRKPEVFKMACLRDIMGLFASRQSPFYAGFGNRLTDALSYRSVNIPSTRIFTINSNSEVSLDLLSLNKYKTGYQSMREIVDHYFPPVGTLVHEGGEEFTDFNYWRERPHNIDDLDMTDSEDEGPAGRLGQLEDEEEDEEDDRGDDDDEIDDDGQADDDDDDELDDESSDENVDGDVLEKRAVPAVSEVAQVDRDTEDEAELDHEEEDEEVQRHTAALNALDLTSSVHPAGHS